MLSFQPLATSLFAPYIASTFAPQRFSKDVIYCIKKSMRCTVSLGWQIAPCWRCMKSQRRRLGRKHIQPQAELCTKVSEGSFSSHDPASPMLCKLQLQGVFHLISVLLSYRPGSFLCHRQVIPVLTDSFLLCSLVLHCLMIHLPKAIFL